MSENAANNHDQGTTADEARRHRVAVLLYLLLAYFLVSIVLDSSFPIPKTLGLRNVMIVANWALAFAIMFLLGRQLKPDAFEGHVDFAQEYEDYILAAVVFTTAAMLSLNIIAGGGVRSPYVSFLSSFPVFSMVLLFDKVDLRSCAKGASIAIGSLALVYGLDFVIARLFGSGIAVSTERLEVFWTSPNWSCLVVAVLLVTALSNLLSLYLGARQERDGDG